MNARHATLATTLGALVAWGLLTLLRAPGGSDATPVRPREEQATRSEPENETTRAEVMLTDPARSDGERVDPPPFERTNERTGKPREAAPVNVDRGPWRVDAQGTSWLAGVVVERGTTAGLAGARVGVDRLRPGTGVSTDENGCFDLPRPEDGRTIVVSAPDYAFGRWFLGELPANVEQEGRLVFPLDPGASLRGRAVYEDGEVLDSGFVVAYDATSHHNLTNPNVPDPWSRALEALHWELWSHPRAEIGADGTFTFRDLMARDAFLVVYADFALRDFHRVAVQEHVDNACTLTLTKGAQVVGTLSWPRAGVASSVSQAGVLVCWHAKCPVVPGVDRWARVGADAAFSSGPVPAGTCFVRAEAASGAPDAQPTYRSQERSVELVPGEVYTWNVELSDHDIGLAPAYLR